MDVVSGGELARALAAGVAEKITFSGVGKTREEIAAALEPRIFCFNVEVRARARRRCRKRPSLSGVRRACRCASIRTSTPARIRRFPPASPKTNSACRCRGRGKSTPSPPSSRELSLAGADMHIGSQLTDLAPFDEAFSLLAELVRDLRADGHDISHVDLGGGLGIPYRDGDDPQSYHPDKYAEIVRRHYGGLGCKLVLEPGRLIVGNAGILVTRVIYVKHGDAKTFVIVDAGMNNLIRPTLYDAWHDIIPVRQSADRKKIVADVVRTCLRDGRLSCPWTRDRGAARRRIALRADGRRLWRRAVGRLQHKASCPGSPG